MTFLLLASLAVTAAPAATTASQAPTSIPLPPPEIDVPPGSLVCEPQAAGGRCIATQAIQLADSAEASAGGDGDIVVTATRGGHRADPLRRANEVSFGAASAVDDALIGPVALTYKHTIPNPVREGVRNFMNNLHEPVVALNFLIQLKPGKAAETVGRFGVNSTVGIAGLFDIARRHPINLPRRANGFADSLGYYGVGSGPYLFLPLIGPTTVSDLAGGTLDGMVLPLGVGRPFSRLAYTVPTALLRGLDRRIAFDAALAKARADGDPYAARRSLYLAQRQAEIDGLRHRGISER